MPTVELDQNGCNHAIHYVEVPSKSVGAGEAFVCIHGLAANLAFWYARIAPQLARLGPVCLYDLRGHGGSCLPASGYDIATQCGDLVALLDRLAISSVHVVAHSFGGAIALALAVHYPERVRSLVLADVRVPVLQPALRIAELPSVPRWRDALRRLNVDFDDRDPESGLLFLSALARLQLERPADAEVLRHAYMGRGSRFGPRAARRWLQLAEQTSAFREFRMPPPYAVADLERLAVPMMILVGEHSVTRPSAHELARLCPHARLKILPRAGHFFPLSRPAQFLMLLKEFYAGLGLLQPRGRSVLPSAEM